MSELIAIVCFGLRASVEFLLEVETQRKSLPFVPEAATVAPRESDADQHSGTVRKQGGQGDGESALREAQLPDHHRIVDVDCGPLTERCSLGQAEARP